VKFLLFTSTRSLSPLTLLVFEYDEIIVQGDDVEGEEEEDDDDDDDDEEEADDIELDCVASKSFILKSLKLEYCP
jgi:hypothetical protein